jgi:hypothetical protein
MTISRILTTSILSILLSCNGVAPTHNRETAAPGTIQAKPAPANDNISSDTIKRFIVDDYPITDSVFGNDQNGRKIKVGSVRSLDKCWFSNDSLKQTIIIELYTDHHRMLTYHFYNDHIPPALIQLIGITKENGDTATYAQKLYSFSGFVSKAKKINSYYFTTNKGIKLGDNIEQVQAYYGKAKSFVTTDGITLYQWNFTGDLLYDGKSDLAGGPLAKDSYGHQTMMFFKNNRLIGLILQNEIP